MSEAMAYFPIRCGWGSLLNGVCGAPAAEALRIDATCGCTVYEMSCQEHADEWPVGTGRPYGGRCNLVPEHGAAGFTVTEHRPLNEGDLPDNQSKED